MTIGDILDAQIYKYKAMLIVTVNDLTAAWHAVVKRRSMLTLSIQSFPLPLFK